MKSNKNFTIVLTLTGFPERDAAWFQREWFDPAIAASQEKYQHADSDARYGEQYKAALCKAYKSEITVVEMAKTTLHVSFNPTEAMTRLEMTFPYGGNMEVSEDGRCLWLRQAFEDLLFQPLHTSLIERCFIRAPEPGAPDDDVRELLKLLKTALTNAMAGANELKSTGFYIVEECAAFAGSSSAPAGP